jgi:uncharacterized membrane protein YsdA (DUF1294 family)
MNVTSSILMAAFLLINIAAFLMMLIDKGKSRKIGS